VVTSPFVLVFVGLGVVGLFGMGAWVRNAAEGAGRYWLRWWTVVAVVFGGPALQEYVSSGIPVVLYVGSWLAFVVIGFRRLWRKYVTPRGQARRVGLGLLSVPVIVVGAWVLDPWTGLLVTGHGMADYWRGRGGEAIVYLGVVALGAGIVAVARVFRTANPPRDWEKDD